MNVFSKIKGWLNMVFLGKAREEFRVVPVESATVDRLLNECANIYAGHPYWIGEDIKTINFAKSLCSEVARLATLGIKVTIDGSARAEYLQKQIDKVYFELRNWTEYGAAFGTIILKPNGQYIEVVTPDHFTITGCENGRITAIVFEEQIRARDGKHWYTRLEYHHREGDVYHVSNKTYYSESQGDIGDAIDISKTPWNMLEEETAVTNLDGNMFAVLRMPHANNIDIDSPFGMPIFTDAIEELKDLDIAYSRNALEIIQSKRTVLIDSDRLLTGKNKKVEMPDFVKAVEGTGEGDIYHEINPLIQTPVRLAGIDALLSQIGYKVGFSNGYFVFNEKSGIQTATGVEAAEQRTIQFIKDVRDKLEDCLKQLIVALNAFADAYDLAPLGEYETNFDFGDITYNVDEDRARWWGYVLQQKIPAWKYFEKFEGMTEDEAKAMVEEATPKMDLSGMPGLE